MNDADAYVNRYLEETARIAASVDRNAIVAMIASVTSLCEREGRLFIVGVGGSAANASHAANDFRKVAGIEAYAPTDNVSELTARTNDSGWQTVFVEWLRVSRLRPQDALLVLSVGGGSESTSKNLVEAMLYARGVGSTILSVVSRDGGRARELSTATILIPTVSAERVTPHAEGWQGILTHLIVNAVAAGCGHSS